jgi:PAS domain S-box-containing protein
LATNDLSAREIPVQPCLTDAPTPEVSVGQDAISGSLAQLAVTRDVTERKRYEEKLREGEEKLREGEERFRSLLEALPAAIYTTDAAGRVTFYNDAAAKLAGRTPKLGSDEWCVTWRLYSPDGTPMPHEQCPMALALKENRPIRGMEAIAERPDGTRVAFAPYPTPLRDASGAVVGAVNMLVDITDRKRIEGDLRRLSEELEERVEQRTKELTHTLAELKQSERRFRLLVQGVTDYAIFMLDPNGLVTNWNTGAERIKGYTSKDIVGRHFSTFYGEEDRRNDVPGRSLATAAISGRFETEGWRLRKDGSRFWASVVIDPIRDERGELIGFAKITRDMTERRAIEEQLRQAYKMEAIGQLTGGISHDFNNLLTAIMGNISLISAETESENVRRHAAAALQSVDRAANLTHQLLAFSRKQRLEAKPTSLNELVSGMSEMLQRTLGGTIRIELALADALWIALIDPNQIENVLLNLAINARDAMPNGGTLTIETANQKVEQLKSDSGLEPGDYVLISVTDTGTGMTDEVRAKAFDPFFTTKDIGKGSGLGLSQVHGVAKQSGGAAEISSILGKGTTVRIYLPRVSKNAEVSAHRVHAEEISAKNLRGTRVLVVDDDEGVRDVTAEALRASGCAVTAVSTGIAALDELRSASFDLLVIDFAMPDMDGVDTVDIVKSRWPNLPVLFITGHANVPALRDVSKDAILRKPFPPAQLAAKARAVLDRRQDTPTVAKSFSFAK